MSGEKSNEIHFSFQLNELRLISGSVFALPSLLFTTRVKSNYLTRGKKMLQLLNKNSHLPNCRNTTIPLRMGSIPSGGCVLEKLWNLNSWKYVNPFHQAAIVFTNLIILNAKFRLRVQVPQPWAWNCLHS